MAPYLPGMTQPRWAAKVVLAAVLGTFALACSLLSRSQAGGDPVGNQTRIEIGRGIDLGSVENGSLVGFSPDGRTLAVTTGQAWEGVGPIRLWDVRTGKERAPVAEGWKQLETVHFSPGGNLLAAHDKKKGMGVWNIRTGKQLAAFRPPTICENYVNFWFSPDGKGLIYEHYGEKFPNDSLLKVRDLGAVRDRDAIAGEPGRIAFSRNGTRIATGTTAPTHDKRDRVMLWAWNEKKPLALLKDYRIRVDQVAFSPDLTAFATVNVPEHLQGAAEIRVVDMVTGCERVTLTHKDKETHIQTIAFSQDGKFLIANGGGGTQLDWKTRSTVWDITTPHARRIGTFPTEPVLSPDGRFLAARGESEVSLRDTATGREKGRLTKPGDVTSSFFFSYNNHKSYPSVAFSPDSRLVVVWGLYRREGVSSLARICQVDPIKELCVLESCSEARFAPDGRALVALTSDGRLRLWRIAGVSVRIPAAVGNKN